MSLLTAGLLTLGLQLPTAGTPPPAATRVRRGPIESRDEFLLAQPRLTLPATSPDAVGRGRTVLRVAGDWGSDFGAQVVRIGNANYSTFFVDDEHRSASLQASRGVSDRLTVQARLPVLWRGGGILDGLIDWWHRLTHLPDGNRPQFPHGQFGLLMVEGAGKPLRWRPRQGSGLGGLELGARWSSAARSSGWTAALEARAQLPTATGAYVGVSPQVGAQALAARTLGRAADVYLGFGATTGPGAAGVNKVEYATVRPQGFVAFEWRPGSRISLLVETTVAGRLIENIWQFPGRHVNLRMGAKLDVGRAWRLEGGFTEGLVPQHATPDFGVFAGVVRRF